MAGRASSANNPFEDLARQLFEGWQGMASSAMPGAVPHAGFGGVGSGFGDFGGLLERFGRGTQEYLAMLSRFGEGQGLGQADAAEVTRFWRQLLSGSGGNPMLDALGSLDGVQARSLLQLGDTLESWLAPLLEQARRKLAQPTFGLAREHQQHQQQLGLDLLDYREQAVAFQRLMFAASEAAFERFQGKLEAHSEPGRQLGSLKALFDLWVDAAEEAYAEAALSEDFQRIYGRLANAQMRVRAGLQRQVAGYAADLGLATRKDIEGGHRRLQELQREVRELRATLAGGASGAGQGAAVEPRAASKPASKPSSRSGAQIGDAPESKPAAKSRAGSKAEPKAKAKAKAKPKPKPKPKAKPGTKSKSGSGASARSKSTPKSTPARAKAGKRSGASRARAAKPTFASAVPVPRSPGSASSAGRPVAARTAASKAPRASGSGSRAVPARRSGRSKGSR